MEDQEDGFAQLAERSELNDQLDAARAAVRGLSEVLERYGLPLIAQNAQANPEQWKPIERKILALLKTHAAEIEKAK